MTITRQPAGSRHGDTMRAKSRLRSRVIAILHAALERSGKTQVEIAALVGVRKSAVSQVLHGSGNLHIDTLGEYLAAMGLEADLVVAELGEFRRARSERRAPATLALTNADHDRLLDGTGVLLIRRPIDGGVVNALSAKADRSGSVEPNLSRLPLIAGASWQ
jgi:transcriptional regulator with XRE-family HTH domain